MSGGGDDGDGAFFSSGTLRLYFIIRSEHHATEAEETCIRGRLMAFVSIAANLFSQIIQALI